MANLPSESTSIRSRAAKHVVQQFVEARHLPTAPGPMFPTIPDTLPERAQSSLPICIVGAGCAGLYAAMILDSLDLDYEILEASDRIGGRLFTYRFNGDAGLEANINDPARYDYVDMGAMRFPHIKFMKRVLDLFTLLDMFEDGLMIKYYYTAKQNNAFQLYNGIRSRGPTTAGEDVFDVSVEKGGEVPDSYVQKGADEVVSDVFNQFAQNFKNLPFSTAWDLLTTHDAKSTRCYMLEDKQYPETVIEWLETFESATGLYNDAFVESTMDAMDFDSSSASKAAGSHGKIPDYRWFCIDGGSDHLSRRMADRIMTNPLLNTRVTAISSSASGEMSVDYVDSHGQLKSRKYSQVICTVPLGCLQAIDIPRKDLSYTQRLAIRALNYDTSTKIALKFKSRWWEDSTFMGGEEKTIQGGISSTDLPIRTCVYPSYGLNTTGPAPGVMLASYTWAQDAQRLGGLASVGKGSDADKRLLELTLQNLAQLHGIKLEKLRSLLVDHFSYNWHSNEYARGAFALFGPNQFGVPPEKPDQSMFASMKAPAADGKLHIAGEATSVHHAWVLGALNSAWRAVFHALDLLDPQVAKTKRKALEDIWGIPDEEDPELLVKLAALARYSNL